MRQTWGLETMFLKKRDGAFCEAKIEAFLWREAVNEDLLASDGAFVNIVHHMSRTKKDELGYFSFLRILFVSLITYK